jgi:hypothetical protein
MVYIRGMYQFSLVCTSTKAINFFEVKVVIQTGDLNLEKKKVTIDVLVSSKLCFPPIVVIYMVIILDD